MSLYMRGKKLSSSAGKKLSKQSSIVRLDTYLIFINSDKDAQVSERQIRSKNMFKLILQTTTKSTRNFFAN